MAKRTVRTLSLSSGTQNSTAGLAPKVSLRKKAIDLVGGPAKACVLDLFSGDGEMHRAVWHAAAAYAGCDLEWRQDGRRVWVCDNLRLLRCINLAGFNVFDLDAYGEPWLQLWTLANRRTLQPGERCSIVLTAGMAKQMINKVPQKTQMLGHALARLAKLERDAVGSFINRQQLIANIARTVGETMGAADTRLFVVSGGGKGSVDGGKGPGSPVIYVAIGMTG